MSCTKKICEFMKCFAILLNVRKVLVANLVLLVERSEERLNNVTNLIKKKKKKMLYTHTWTWARSLEFVFFKDGTWSFSLPASTRVE